MRPNLISVMIDEFEFRPQKLFKPIKQLILKECEKMSIYESGVFPDSFSQKKKETAVHVANIQAHYYLW